ncbi:MAG: hypothetical protein H7144_16755 [Burkholderiales bacterium]|nr:hypothetical protein [Phycisphaerae bacterium]
MQIRTRGFSFTELLFAVMILGIGFIMLAAIFPVGLSQTKSNYEESLGAGIGRGASHQLGQIANEARLKPAIIGTVPTGLTVPAGKSVSLGLMMSPRDKRLAANLWTWKDVCRNLVLSSDPRFAWSPLFLRKTTYTNDTLAPLVLDNGTGGINPALAAKPDSLEDFSIKRNRSHQT